MDAYLKLKNKPNVIGAAANFTYHWGVSSGLNREHATRLALAVSELVTDVVLFAFGEQEGEMEIFFARNPEQVEVVVHEFGEPFHPELHPYDPRKAIQEGNFDGAGLELIKQLTDEFIFLNKGKQGKEFRLLHKISTPHITELVPAEDLVEHTADLPEPEYTLRPISTEDGEYIAKLIYRTYGHTYHKERMYFPREVALSIEQKEKFGVIAWTQTGEPAGYFAVLRKTDSNICEVGEAVVSLGHRRKGVMKQMLRKLVAMARERGLLAAYGEATAAHIISQRVNGRFGFTSAALALAVSPAMELSGFSPKTSAQDLSTVMEFVLLNPVPERHVYLPAKYKPLLKAIYRELKIANRDQPLRKAPEWEGVTELEVAIDYDDRLAVLVVHHYGADFSESLGQTVADLDQNQINTIAIDLPLNLPHTKIVPPLLREHGFIFAGLLPVFHHEEDYLRFQRTFSRIDFDLIKVLSPLAHRLKRIVVKEYHEMASHTNEALRQN